MLAAVKQNGLALEHADKELQDSYDVVEKAISKNKNAFNYASKRLQDSYHIKNIAGIQSSGYYSGPERDYYGDYGGYDG